MTISAIIPCYNEDEKIISIIETLKSSKKIYEIIVVDDGSNLKTKKVLKSLKNIKLLVHKKNLGKSQAMKTGLLNSVGEIIVFLDADLINFRLNHLNNLIQPVINQKFPLSIGEFDDKFRLFNYTGHTVLFSGIRCYHQSVLKENINIFDDIGYVNGFLIESRSNLKFLYSNCFAKVKLAGVTQDYKWQKSNFFDGSIKDIKVMLKILSFMGLKEYFREIILVNKTKYFSN